jgi:hypothetical protein
LDIVNQSNCESDFRISRLIPGLIRFYAEENPSLTKLDAQ